MGTAALWFTRELHAQSNFPVHSAALLEGTAVQGRLLADSLHQPLTALQIDEAA